MTREEAKKAAEVMLAFANGETIERYKDSIGEWVEVDSHCAFKWDVKDYRVKPKERFDPKTLQPFDKVLVFDTIDKVWRCDLYSHKVNEQDCFNHINSYRSILDATDKVIPYNEETKHLVGTSNDAPEYYKYWKG